MPSPRYLRLPDGTRLGYHRVEGRSPGVVFLGGFTSDMTGTKALALERHCRAQGRAYVRFDYFGHGISDGAFAQATIGRWRSDAVAVLDQVTDGPQVLVGSSMGGWMMVLVALARPARVVGLVGVASAPDFTEELVWARFDEPTRTRLREVGTVDVPSEYGNGLTTISWRLLEEAREHLLLDRPIAVDHPVRLLHGMDDDEVPWQTSARLAEALQSQDVTLTLIKDGTHRMSRPADLARLMDTVEGLCRAPEGAGSQEASAPHP